MAMPDDVGEGYESLKDMGYAPRGFFFWALDNEGVCEPCHCVFVPWFGKGTKQCGGIYALAIVLWSLYVLLF